MPFNMAIVGFGRMAQKFYVPALKLLAPDSRYAIVDPANDARIVAQKTFPEASCFAAVEGLAGLALDAALVASPPATHFHAWRLLVARNVPIFMEKPFPLPDEIGAVEEVVQHGSPLFMVNFNRRFWLPYQRLLGMAKSGAIGEIQSASLQLIADPAVWNRSREAALTSSDGALHDLGCHVVDFALRLFGSLPSAVISTPSTAACFTGLSLTLKWPDGCSVNADVGYGKTLETISVAGSGGILTMYDPHGHIWRDRRERTVSSLGRGVADLMTMSGYVLRPRRTILRATTLAALRVFLNCVRTRTAPTPGLTEALQVAGVLAAADDSLVSGNCLGSWNEVQSQPIVS
jgi:predicted dehydrogenase